MIGIARWLLILLGGALLGAGLVLHGQVALARYMRDEVDNTFVLWRAMGHATFAFQGGETRMALAMAEVPEQALKHSDRAAGVLLIAGGIVALGGPLLVRRRSRVVAKSAGGKKRSR